MSRAWLFPILIAGFAATLIALVGMTITDLGPWYRSLVQPSWAPPDAVYGAAWTAIYAFAALSGVSGWLAMPHGREREWLIGLFALNGFLNVAWSLLFFRFHRPDWALFEVAALWISVAILIAYIGRRSTRGAILLLPYLIWVSFAALLNQAIVALNGPFS